MFFQLYKITVYHTQDRGAMSLKMVWVMSIIEISKKLESYQLLATKLVIKINKITGFPLLLEFP